MREGEASTTARRVAAHRLTFTREPAPYGDPAAEETLARDVADGVPGGTGPMVRYLQARTTFFDRVVVRSIDGGVRQVVVAAAGYDGRALRYAKPGVRWFELDHPDTQRDKRARLERLGIDVAHVSFASADFAVDPVATVLHDAGHDPATRSLFLVEGVAAYLEPTVLESLLATLRSAAADGSTMAISLSTDTGSRLQGIRRAALASRVAAIGEPIRSVLTPAGAAELFARTGWQPRPTSDQAGRAGLVLAVTAG